MFPSHQNNIDDQSLQMISSSEPYNQHELLLQQLPQQELIENTIHEGQVFKTIEDHYSKKLKHRDIERQRRHEMSTLYASLRNLLPLEYVKGKRSMSDHMQEATRYIKDLRNEIKELGIKRDELKNLSNSSNFGPKFEASTSHGSPSRVMVRECIGGVEVVITSGLEKQVLCLSRAIDVMTKYGHEIVSCVSTRVNERLIHTIQSEVGDNSRIDIPKLQSTLEKELCM